VRNSPEFSSSEAISWFWSFAQGPILSVHLDIGFQTPLFLRIHPLLFGFFDIYPYFAICPSRFGVNLSFSSRLSE
jgi:hypothetical protein